MDQGDDLSASTSLFLVSITGQIESGDFFGHDNIYCKFWFTHGPDWVLTAGVEEGITQVSQYSQNGYPSLVWNFPLEATFRSSNPSGWPQLVISCYGPDIFGNDVIRGYGLCHIPTQAGKAVKRLSLFVPDSTTMVQKLTAWMTGRRPEFIEPRFLAKGEGREVIRACSQGYIKVCFNVITKDFHSLGYDNGSRQPPNNSFDTLLSRLENINIQ